MKEISNVLIDPLTSAVNQWFRSNDLPSSMKVGRTKPLHKGGDPSQCGNHRPVSIPSNFSKLCERILSKRLNEFVEKAEIISNRQYGFTNNSNTTGAALNLVVNLVQSVENKKYTAVLFLDVSKAFDCVDHQVLLAKIEELGIRGPANRLIEDYLFGRMQKIVEPNCISDSRTVRCGIPQGSPLSSTLFLLYINDIFELRLNGTLQLFCDDGACSYSANSLDELNSMINEDLILLDRWFYNNLLTFNVAKTKFMLITQRNLRTNDFATISLNGTEVERVYQHKYLGLMIDSSLSWKPHIELIKSKVRPFLAVLRRCHYLLDTRTRLSLYYSHIHSHLMYMISVWGSAAGVELDRLQVLQNKAIRHIFWTEYHRDGMSTDQLFRVKRIMNIDALIRYENILTVYKIKTGRLRSGFGLSTNNETGLRSGRRQSLVGVPPSRTNYQRNSVLHRGVNWYNELPSGVRGAATLEQFKKNVKNLILNQS